MRRFLLNAGLGMTLFLMLSWGLHQWAPVGWAKPELAEKMHIWSQATPSKSYNAVAFGSSHIYRQFSPDIFDSVAQARGIRVSSYNLGAPSTFSPESFTIAEHVLQESIPEDSLEWMFVELMEARKGPPRGFPGFWQSAKGSYFMNISELRFCSLAALQRTVNWHKRLKGVLFAVKSFIARTLCLNHHNMLSVLLGGERCNSKMATMLRWHHGWVALDDELAFTKSKALRRRMESLGQTPLALPNAIDPQDIARPVHAEDVQLCRLKRMIDLGKAKGVHVIFVAVPGSPQRNLRVLQLGHTLPKGHFLDIADPDRHPEFYLRENKFDGGHLNKTAAEQMTAVLAQAFVAAIDNL